jgi:hypothetical protein
MIDYLNDPFLFKRPLMMGSQRTLEGYFNAISIVDRVMEGQIVSVSVSCLLI